MKFPYPPSPSSYVHFARGPCLAGRQFESFAIPSSSFAHQTTVSSPSETQSHTQHTTLSTQSMSNPTTSITQASEAPSSTSSQTNDTAPTDLNLAQIFDDITPEAITDFPITPMRMEWGVEQETGCRQLHLVFEVPTNSSNADTIAQQMSEIDMTDTGCECQRHTQSQAHTLSQSCFYKCCQQAVSHVHTIANKWGQFRENRISSVGLDFWKNECSGHHWSSWYTEVSRETQGERVGINVEFDIIKETWGEACISGNGKGSDYNVIVIMLQLLWLFALETWGGCHDSYCHIPITIT